MSFDADSVRKENFTNRNKKICSNRSCTCTRMQYPLNKEGEHRGKQHFNSLQKCTERL